MLQERIDEYVNAVEKRLYDYVGESGCKQKRVIDAMRYSLEAGGKRVRPVLAMEFCRLCCGEAERALSVACAIEMTHTFSLIHDDLPCMDDDDLRRGKPSCHKAFDEVTALLAGDALAILPFRVIAEDKALSDAQKTAITAFLAKCAGETGMIGGQQIDTEFEGKRLSGAELLAMYELKTSKLLEAACCCGVIAGGGTEKQIEAAAMYAKNLGLAFQIVDDLLDVCGDEVVLGKPVGSDEKDNKFTYVGIYGAEKAREAAAEFTGNAVGALGFFENTGFIGEYTKLLLDRTK